MLFQDNSFTPIFITAFLIIIGTFLYVGIKTLKRNPSNRTNQTFAIFFFETSWALGMNLPAPFMSDQSIRGMFVLITAYGVSISLGILLVFTLILHLSNKIVTDKRKWTIVCLFALAFAGYFLIPGGVYMETVSGATYVRFSVPLAVYFLVGTQAAYVLILWLAFKVYKKFGDQSMQKRFRYFLFGLICFQVMMLAIPLLNVGWLPGGTQVLMFMAFPGAILIYLGVGKTL